MTVTFRLDRPSKSDRSLLERLCPSCGGASSVLAAAHPDKAPDRGCEDCQGYGGDREAEEEYRVQEERESVNVANTTARVLLGWMGLRRDAELVGGLEALRVGEALARVRSASPERAAVPARVERGGVFVDENGVGERCALVDFGLPVERLRDVQGKLSALLERAKREGVGLTWA